ncbi:MAG: PilZ domain-containing protein [Phycisphaerae bacterium]|nr:PilZ domain-containing protein [Phycisphaerae bacterium]
MAMLKDLDAGTIRQSATEAAERGVPVAVSVRYDERWENLFSRVLAVRDDRLLLSWPVADAGSDACPHEFTPAEKVGLSFKLKHYKYLTTVAVAGPDRFKLDTGAWVPVLSVCFPVRMQRLQRRAYQRAEVPAGRIVRGSFWLGGCAREPVRGAEPSGAPEGTPVWSGSVTNLSAGGLQLHANAELADMLDPGDVVGMHVVFGAGEDVVHTDAQFRRAELTEDGCLLGFQFLGLGQSRDGRRALQCISDKVSAFHAEMHRTAAAR